MAKIYSTATCDSVFGVYKKASESAKISPRRIEKTIIIKGNGETTVTPDELKQLQEDKVFSRKVANGFYHLNKKPETKKKDKSAQISPADMEKKAKAAAKGGDVKVNTGKVDGE